MSQREPQTVVQDHKTHQRVYRIEAGLVARGVQRGERLPGAPGDHHRLQDEILAPLQQHNRLAVLQLVDGSSGGHVSCHDGLSIDYWILLLFVLDNRHVLQQQ